MLIHHVFKEKDFKKSCLYCGNDLNSAIWGSFFFSNIHYKETRCSCGKNISIKVNFDGSGHDFWDKSNNLTQNFCAEHPNIKSANLEKKVESKK